MLPIFVTPIICAKISHFGYFDLGTNAVWEASLLWCKLGVCHKLTLVCIISRLMQAENSLNSFLRSATWLFIRSFVWLILSPWFESKFEFVCHHSRHQLQISQSINGFFLVHWTAWFTAFLFKIYLSCWFTERCINIL